MRIDYLHKKLYHLNVNVIAYEVEGKCKLSVKLFFANPFERLLACDSL